MLLPTNNFAAFIRSSTFYLHSSNCLFNSKDYKRAIDVCRHIIDLDPAFYYAYNRMGLCFIKLEIEEEAKKFFEKFPKKKTVSE